MMRVRWAGPALVAVFALSAVAVSSASAAKPEWLHAKKALTKAVTVTGKAGAGKLTSTAGTEIKCEANTSSGEIEGSKSAKKIVVKYTGCVEGTKKCKTTGAKEGEIVTNAVKGELVYVNKAKTIVGELLKPESGEVFVAPNCGAEIQVKGELIGEALPLNTESTSGELDFVATNGVQKWQQIEEAGTKHHLSAFAGFVEAGLNSSESLTFGEAVEISA
jgi:hypothetical protein